MSSGINVNQIISLAKRFLLPQVRKWLKERKKRKQQQQQPQQAYSQQSNQNGQYQQQYQQPQQQYHQQQGNYGNNNHQQSYAGAAGGAAGAYYGAQSASYNNNDDNQQHQYSMPSSYGGPSYPSTGQSYSQPPHQQYKPPQHVNTDSQHASDPHYVQLRNQALQEDYLMGQAFDAASSAYKTGDGARAKELSNEGKAHQRRKEELNDEAADWIFAANNSNQPPGSIDLHGLYVQEAIERTERAVQSAQSQGFDELRIITGKGTHSNQGIAKIKPAIEKLMVKYNLSAHLDPSNSGVLIVNLSGRGGGSRDLGWVDQADRESDPGQCLVM